MGTMTPEAAFVHAINSLGPYRQEVIVLGGWASRLYAYHPQATPIAEKGQVPGRGVRSAVLTAHSSFCSISREPTSRSSTSRFG